MEDLLDAVGVHLVLRIEAVGQGQYPGFTLGGELFRHTNRQVRFWTGDEGRDH